MDLVLMGPKMTKAYSISLLKLEFRKSIITRKKK